MNSNLVGVEELAKSWDCSIPKVWTILKYSNTKILKRVPKFLFCPCCAERAKESYEKLKQHKVPRGTSEAKP